MSKYKDVDLPKFGKRIKAQRQVLKMSREEFADELGVTPNFVTDVESGTKGLSINNLYKTTQILNVTADYLFEGAIVDDEKEQVIESIAAQLRTLKMQHLKYATTLNSGFAAAVREEADYYDEKAEEK